LNSVRHIPTVILALAGIAGAARANTILFATGPVRLSGGAVNASASFDIDPIHDTVAISVLNLQDNPGNVGQLISGISFTLSHLAGGLATPSIISERATEITIDSMGRIVEAAPKTDTDWKIVPATGSTWDLCTICSTGGSPDQLLISGPASSGAYTGANGSIAGNASHNPFLLATAGSTPTWTIRLDSLQPSTGVTAVRFQFGTTYATIYTEGRDVTAIPEPGTVVLIGVACVALGISAQRKRGRPHSDLPRIGLQSMKL
jgi:hypothetical protein